MQEVKNVWLHCNMQSTNDLLHLKWDCKGEICKDNGHVYTYTLMNIKASLKTLCYLVNVY